MLLGFSKTVDAHNVEQIHPSIKPTYNPKSEI